MLAENSDSHQQGNHLFTQKIFALQSASNSQSDRIQDAKIMDVQEGIRLHFVTRSQLG